MNVVGCIGSIDSARGHELQVWHRSEHVSDVARTKSSGWENFYDVRSVLPSLSNLSWGKSSTRDGYVAFDTFIDHGRYRDGSDDELRTGIKHQLGFFQGPDRADP